MSVLRGMKERLPGNIETKESYSADNAPARKKQAETNIFDKKTPRNTFKNQEFQIKISGQLKEEINALKSITKTKFDYEVIELLIDSYDRNEFSPTQRRKFRAMTSDEGF